MRLAGRAAAGVLLVGLGLVLSPQAVPVYDGIDAPDEPYRYVVRPLWSNDTPPPTSASATSPVRNGVSLHGLSLATREVGPQFSLFLPVGALRVLPVGAARAGDAFTVQVTPVAAAVDAPPGTRVDGNTYAVAFAVPGRQVSLTPQAALASLQIRATTGKQPPPVVQHRPAAGQPWVALETARVGVDIYAAKFPGVGEFQLVFAVEEKEGGGSGGAPQALLGLGVLVLVASVVVVRLRSAR